MLSIPEVDLRHEEVQQHRVGSERDTEQLGCQDAESESFVDEQVVERVDLLHQLVTP